MNMNSNKKFNSSSGNFFKKIEDVAEVDVVEKLKTELRLLNGVQQKVVNDQIERYENFGINSRNRFECMHTLIADTCKKSFINFLKELSIIFVSIAQLHQNVGKCFKAETDIKIFHEGQEGSDPGLKK